MSLSIEQLRSVFKQKENEGSSRPSNYYPFWNISEGSQAVLRFLPDKNPANPMGFVVEKLMHTLTINGENKSIPCLKMYDEDCPICKVSSAYYKEEDNTNGKKYYRKKQHLAQVLVMEDPLPADETTHETHEGKVRFVAIGYQLFRIIQDAFESGELDEIPYAYDGGTNFIIKKTKQGEYPSYSLSKFSRRSDDLTEDQRALVEENIIDLSTLLPQNPGLEKVEAMLEAALTGTSYSDGSSSGGDRPLTFKKKEKVVEDEDEDDVPFAVEDKPTKAKPEPVAVVDDSDDGMDEEAEAILKKIRARQANKDV